MFSGGRRGGRRLLAVERSTLGLELDELSCYVVTAAVRQDPQDCPAGLIKVNTAGQRTPESTAGPLHHVSHLQHRQTHDSVLACETVVADTQVKFVEIRVGLASQRTVPQHHISIRYRLWMHVRPSQNQCQVHQRSCLDHRCHNSSRSDFKTLFKTFVVNMIN